MLEGLRKSFAARSKSWLWDNRFCRPSVPRDICDTIVSHPRNQDTSTSWQVLEYEELLSMDIVAVYKWYPSTKEQGLRGSCAKFRWLQK